MSILEYDIMWINSILFKSEVILLHKASLGLSNNMQVQEQGSCVVSTSFPHEMNDLTYYASSFEVLLLFRPIPMRPSLEKID